MRPPRPTQIPAYGDIATAPVGRAGTVTFVNQHDGIVRFVETGKSAQDWEWLPLTDATLRQATTAQGGAMTNQGNDA